MDNLNTMNDKNKILKIFKYSSAFYKDRLRNIKTFEDVPFTTKNDLLKAQDIIKPYGDFTNCNYPIYQIYRTSGTTASPLLLTFTKKDIELITDIGKECFEYSGMGGIGNKEVVINCLNLSMWAGGFFDSQAMMKTGVQVINFGTGNTIELIKLILHLRQKYKVSLHCTPSYLPVIERKLKNELDLLPSDLGIYVFYLGAEGGVQNNAFRNSLIDKWNAKIFNANYGMSEVCSIMASANEENLLKFSNLLLENYFLEIVDGNDIYELDSFEKGIEGDLVFSSIKKESQPLLRYQTKERIRVLEFSDKGLFFEVVGRADDMLVFKGVNFFPEQIRSSISSYKQLTGIYKLLVKKDEGIIKQIDLICEIKSENNNDLAILKLNIENKLRDEFSLKLNVKFVDNLEFIGNKIKIVSYI